MIKTRVLLLALACTALFGIFFLFQKINSGVYDKSYKLHLANKDILLTVVNTNEEKNLGLGNKESLLADKAMLFVFKDPAKYGIWMKDMKFPIDIFWLDEKKQIITIETNISPNTYPKVFYPSNKSSYVLETNRNFAKENNLSVGKVLNFDLK